MLASRPLTKRCPETGKLYPADIPREECQCGYLPREDRDYCTKHGTNAKPQPQSEPKPEPPLQPRRVVSVGRTQPLYDGTAGSSALDKIEDIVNRTIMDGKNKPDTPRCQFKGAVPHPARPAYQLVWDLPSGPVVRWSCARLRHSFGGNRGYWVNRTEGYSENGEPRSHELAALLDMPEEARLHEMTEEEERAFCESDEETPTCVDPKCGNPAPYNGAWCDPCQLRWEDEQRAKAAAAEAEGRPRAINRRRGF